MYGLTLLVLTLFPIPRNAAAETVCIQCHTAQTGRGLKPVKPWQESIHAENGISCHHCHGGDAADAANAMDPARGFLGAPKETAIPDFCGRCHIGIKSDYLKSAHGHALGKGGPTCVTCHGSHGIKKAALELINEKTCTQCHSFERARVIRTAMEQTEHSLTTLTKRLDAFKAKGVDTDALEKRLFAERNRYHTLFHEVNTAKVKAESGLIAGELDKLKTALDKIDEKFKKRKMAGAAAVGAALLAAVLFHLLRKTYS
ncbi:cytochrome c [Geobacter sp. SVR]|nr:cytochrome c [Geobacter sp. SVR]